MSKDFDKITFLLNSRLSGNRDPVIQKFCLTDPEILDQLFFSRRGCAPVRENLNTLYWIIPDKVIV
jgi:hypothetical protein